MVMSDERRNEIAYLFLQHLLHQRGCRFTPKFREEIIKEFDKAKIPCNEGLEFLRGMVSTILIGEVLKDEPPTDNRLWGKER